MNFRKLLTYLTVGTAAVIPFAGAQNPTILQGSYISNVFGNSNFVLNPNAQTNVANVTNATRVITTPLVATSEFNLNLASGSFATWTLRAFDAGMKGQNCEARFSYRGFATATTKAEIVQNSLVVATLTLTPSTDPRIASINFPCGDLVNATTFRIAQTTANMTIVTPNEIGGIYVGLATNMANVAQAELAGATEYANCATQFSVTSATFAPQSTVASCTLNNFGNATTSTKDLSITIPNAKPGFYQINANILPYSQTVNGSCYWSIKEDTSGYISGSTYASPSAGYGAASLGASQLSASYNNTTTSTRTWRVVAKSSSGACLVDPSQAPIILSVYRFPSSSELVVTPERQNTFGGVRGYSASQTNIVTSASWTKLTATATLTREVFGKADTAASNDLSMTLKNLPVGTYEIKSSGVFQATASGSGNSTFCAFGVSDLASPTNTLGSIQVAATGDATSTTQEINGSSIIGIYNNTSVADRTFTIFAQRLSGAGSCSLFSTQTNRPWVITVTPLDQPSNSALYVEGPVKAAATGAAIAASYVGEVKYQKVGVTNISSAAYTNLNTVTLTNGVWLCSTQARIMRNGATVPANNEMVSCLANSSSSACTVDYSYQTIGVGYQDGTSATYNYKLLGSRPSVVRYDGTNFTFADGTISASATGILAHKVYADATSGQLQAYGTLECVRLN